MKKLILTSLMLISGTAIAHTGHHHLGISSGLLHPFTGLDHLLALLATGLWLAQSETRPKSIFILGFASVMAAAIALGAQWRGVTFEAGIIASLMVLGALLACAVRGALWMRAAIVAATALMHGFVHGAELPADGDVLYFAAGLVLSSAAATGIAMFIGIMSRPYAHGAIARVAGGIFLIMGLASAI